MTSPSFRFDPETAAAVSAASQGLREGVNSLLEIASGLRLADGNGSFPSGIAIQQTLVQLGLAATTAANRLEAAVSEYTKSVIDAGGLISQQEAENRRRIAKAGSGESSDPLGIGQLMSGSKAPVANPTGPNPTDMLTSGMSSGLPSLPSSSGAAAGKFSCAASPESVGGLTLDRCVSNLSPAEAARLTMLAQQWQQLGADLTSSITVFHNIVQSKMAAGGWTGSSGKAVGDAAHKLVNTSVEIAAQANANGAAIVGWAGALGDTKSYIDSLAASKGPAMAAAPPESQATVQNQIDTMARMKMLSTYNPGVAAISSSLSNLSDPSAGATGVPLVLAGMGGSGGGGGAGGGTGTSAASSGGGGGGGASGGGGGGGGSTAARTGPDAAGQLARQGTGDPVSNAAKNASSQAGQNPASAAQQAVSKAGDGAKSLGGSRSGAGSMTRPSGLGALSEAERNAAKAAAGGLKGAGGGGGGGGGAGKLGGAGGLGGAAAAESALSRNSSSLSAAEKALAGQQGATASRAASPAAGGPMGARGAGAQGEEGKQHKAAKYLKHAQNGEEIAGDLPDTAPPVLGGLNLDTTDDTPIDHGQPRRDS